MDPPSFRGELYLIAFTCDNSRYTFAYPLTKKSDSTSALRAFNEELIQRGKRSTSITIRVDNDRVLKDGDFAAYAKENSIVITKSQPYIPETNSRAETVWRTLQYMANAQLYQSGLDASYWTLSYLHAVDLRNNLPHKFLNYMSPVEKAFGTAPDLERVFIWGSPCYVWVPPKLRKKLDPKARPGLYVGRAKDSKNYLVLDIEKNKAFETGTPVVREDPLEHGKRLVEANPNFFLPIILQDRLLSHPQPRFDGAVRGHPVIVKNVCTYYDIHDHETVGVVKFTSSKNPDAMWTTARNFVTTNHSGYALLSKHLSGSGSFSSAQTFPVFSVVDIDLKNTFDKPVVLEGNPDSYPALVVSFDVSNIDCEETMFGVLVDPQSDDTWGGPYFDIRASCLDFRCSPLQRGSVDYAKVHNLAAKTPLHPTLLGKGDIKIPVNYTPPATYNKAMKDIFKNNWAEAIDVELTALLDKGVLEFIDIKDLPAGFVPLGTRWILVPKVDQSGFVSKFKARLVAKCYSQVQGVNYEETFAPVPQLITFRLVRSLALRFALDVQHIDVKTEFLNASLDVNPYVKLP